MDIAATPDAVEVHDVVVLHRVVCCYPDYERLLTAAADHAARLLVFSHPPNTWVSRTLTALENSWFRLTRKSFRTFAHPPESPWSPSRRVAVCAPTSPTSGRTWHIVGLVRSNPAA